MQQLTLQFFEELRRTQFQSSEWIAAYQRQRLEKLLRHARANVPFYRDSGRLDPLFRSDGLIDWGRWNEVPLLKRKDVQQNFEALKAERLGPEHGRTWTLSTSGSTGEPVTVLRTELAGHRVWNAQLLRDLERHRIDPTRRLIFLYPPPATWKRGDPPKRSEGWYRGLAELGYKGERYFLADTLPAKKLVDEVAALRPVYLLVQPVALELLVANDTNGALRDIGVEVAMTVGEEFTQDSKREVGLHLGCRFMDQYASEECGRIATSCPTCGRFHVDAEVVHLEVVSDKGEEVAAGESGWILTTPLYSFAMPLIRYDHADIGIVGQPEQCEIRLPALDRIVGKERVPFVFADGTSIRPTVSTKTVVEMLGAQAYQFVQVAPDRCEARIVPGSIPPENMRVDEMTKHLRSIWWKDLQIDYKFMESLPRRSLRSKVPLFSREDASDRGVEPAGTDKPTPESEKNKDVSDVMNEQDSRARWNELKAEYANVWRRLERSSFDELLHHQALQAERLARFVRDHVPAMAGRVAPLFDGDIFRPERWGEVPILTRRDLRDLYPALADVRLPAEMGSVSVASTSGSTGEPVKLRRTALATLIAQSFRERACDWYGLDPNAKMASIRRGWPNSSWPDGGIEAQWSAFGPEGELVVLDIRTPTEQQLEWLSRTRPRYLSTMTSNLDELAFVAKRAGLRLQFDSILTTGTKLLPKTRELVGDVFDSRVIDQYSCEEIGPIAYQCPESDLMHVCAEHLIAEVLDEHGEPVEPGGSGRLILTGLYNFATPLLRYEIGDFVATSSDNCSCGRVLPALRAVVGRERKVIEFPDGKRVRPMTTVVAAGVPDMLRARQFQVTHIAPFRFEIRYVPEENSQPPNIEIIRDRYREMVHPLAEVELVEVVSIPRTESGKHQDFVALAR